MPVIRTPLGVGKYVLITGIKYKVDMRTVFQNSGLQHSLGVHRILLRGIWGSVAQTAVLEDGSYIRNVLITGIHCITRV